MRRSAGLQPAFCLNDPPSRLKIGAPSSRCANPAQVLECGAIFPPEINAIVMHASHDTHAFGGAVETRMFKKVPREIGGVIRPHVQPDQTVGRMTQCGVEEITVQSKERHTAMPV